MRSPQSVNQAIMDDNQDTNPCAISDRRPARYFCAILSRRERTEIVKKRQLKQLKIYSTFNILTRRQIERQIDFHAIYFSHAVSPTLTNIRKNTCDFQKSCFQI